MNCKKTLTLVVCLGLFTAVSTVRLQGQQDPGPRAGAAGAGSFYPGLGAGEQSVFTQSMQAFMEVDSVSGEITNEGGTGLGPTFNGNSCAQCHAQPAIGGSSPGLKSPQNSIANPQVALATLNGAINKVPPFITSDGPVREARFVVTVTQQGAVPDGGVHGLFTITGRSDAGGCNLAQPSFARELSRNNVRIRIPTPLFGLGPGGSDAGLGAADESGSEFSPQSLVRDSRRFQHERQRRHHHALRMEGAEQIAAGVFGGSVQR